MNKESRDIKYTEGQTRGWLYSRIGNFFSRIKDLKANKDNSYKYSIDTLISQLEEIKEELKRRKSLHE